MCVVRLEVGCCRSSATASARTRSYCMVLPCFSMSSVSKRSQAVGGLIIWSFPTDGHLLMQAWTEGRDIAVLKTTLIRVRPSSALDGRQACDFCRENVCVRTVCAYVQLYAMTSAVTQRGATLCSGCTLLLSFLSMCHSLTLPAKRRACVDLSLVLV